MHSFKHNRIFVWGAWLIWLLGTSWIAWKHFQQPDFSVGLWAIPAVGFLFCMGVVVWALLEADKDLVWKDNPPLKDEEIENAKLEVAASTQDISLTEQVRLDVPDGKRIDGWNGWRKIIEGFPSTMSLYAAFHFVVFVPIKILFGSNSERLWGEISVYAPLVFLGVIFYWFRIRTKTIYENPLHRLERIAAEFRESHFYEYQSSSAKRLGFQEVGDFTQSGFARTVFTNFDKSVLVEIGFEGASPCYKITSAMPDGKILQTSTSGIAMETDKAIHRTLHPTYGASGQIRWKSISEAVKKHVKWVSEYVSENDSRLLILNEENLSKVMLAAESKPAKFDSSLR